MAPRNLSPKVKKSAAKILSLARKSRGSMQMNQMNFVRTSKFIKKESARISKPKIDKRKLKKLLNTDFSSIAGNAGGGGGIGGLLGLGGGGGGGRGRGGRRGGKPPSRRAQQRYRRRFGNRAGNRRFGRLPQFGRGAGGVRGGFGVRGGLLGAAFAGLEYGGRVSEGQTQTQAITGTAASTAGGIAGAYAGGKAGALAGGAIGAFFGGVGAVPGAAIGGVLGSLIGGFGGSMLAGGAADKVTGADKLIGKDGKKEQEELKEKTKIDPLEVTLDKFDSVVERFSKAILSLNLAGEEEEKSDEEIAVERYGEDVVEAFKRTQDTARRNEEKARKKEEEKQKAITDIKKGPFGDILAETMFPGEKEDATAKTLNALGVPQEYQGITAMMIESLVGGIAMSRGRGVPARPIRPLTKPTSIKIGDRVGPDIFPVKPPVSTSSVKPTTQVTGPLSKPKPRVLSEAMNSAGNTRAKLGEFNDVGRAQLDAMRDMLGGSLGKGYKKPQVEPIQEMIKRALKSNIKPEFNPSSLTEPLTNFMPKGGTQLKLDIPKISTDKNPFKPSRTIEKNYGDQSSAVGIDQSLDSGIKQSSAGINQYTTYNGPNNTIALIQGGGNSLPQPPSPPTMMASASLPPLPSPSAREIADKFQERILLNTLAAT